MLRHGRRQVVGDTIYNVVRMGELEVIHPVLPLASLRLPCCWPGEGPAT